MNTGRRIPSCFSTLLCGCGLALAVALAGGCDFKGWNLGRSKDPKPPPKDPKDAKIEQLQAEVDTLTAQVDELGKRNNRLAEKLNELEFLNRQLTKQLRVVGNAPRMRDYYRDMATKRQLEVEQLRRRIRTLEKLLGIPTTAPATRPTTGPATRPASRPGGGG